MGILQTKKEAQTPPTGKRSTRGSERREKH